ncbi:MAG: lipopolysaccharide biosynthesis protein [Armatimonadetes bacterium]|nr:lipopolysaccharide biosynthesis protein [Armatimonadota bacterium]
MSSTSLRKNFSVTFIGMLVYSAGNFLMNILLAKLSPENSAARNLGIYQIGVTYSQPILAFTMMNLRAVYTTDIHHQFKFGTYFAVRLAMMGVAFAAYIAMAPVARLDQIEAAAVLLTGVGLFFDALSDIYYGIHQLHDDLRPMSFSLGAKGILSPIFLAVGFGLTHQPLVAIAGSAAASGVVALVYDWPSAVKAMNGLKPPDTVTIYWNWAEMRQVARKALPLGLSLLLGSLSLYLTRLVTHKSLGKEAVGIFSAVALLPMIGNAAVTSLGQVLSPKLARYWGTGDRASFLGTLAKLHVVALAAGFIGVAGAFFFGDWLLQFFFKKSFSQYRPELVLMLVAGTFEYLKVCQGVSLTAMRQFGIQTPLMIVTLVVTYAAAVSLIPNGGVHGAVMAAILGSGAACIVFIVTNVWLIIIGAKHIGPANPSEATPDGS